ncbi:MAG TPA: ABC transporter substrate-binding protein, partial [Thermoflexales bacterium]|nr:ABC transporter substrate-binding protein [Thermoflexales bacterium]
MSTVRLASMGALAALLAACSGAAPTAAPAKPTDAPKPAATAAPAQPKAGGTLIAARSEDMKGLDPHKQTAFSSFRMLELVYDPLFTFDKDMKVIPNLAESYKFSEDGKTMTVVLRKGVKFHNGDAMTSDDVKFTFERIADEKTAAAARSTFAGIDSMDTPDANTIVFKLKAANGALPAAMTNIN